MRFQSKQTLTPDSDIGVVLLSAARWHSLGFQALYNSHETGCTDFAIDFRSEISHIGNTLDRHIKEQPALGT
jgi:hypothetical protein